MSAKSRGSSIELSAFTSAVKKAETEMIVASLLRVDSLPISSFNARMASPVCWCSRIHMSARGPTALTGGGLMIDANAELSDVGEL